MSARKGHWMECMYVGGRLAEYDTALWSRPSEENEVLGGFVIKLHAWLIGRKIPAPPGGVVNTTRTKSVVTKHS
ncbi:hypothetical protein MRX96_053921 [Rhipicephalus microplus]